MSEHGPVEGTEVAFLLAGWMMTAWCAIRLLFGGQPIVSEMLLGTLLDGRHQRAGAERAQLGGVPHPAPAVFSLRLSARLIFSWVVFSICVIIVLAVVRYMVRHRRALLGVLRGLPRSRWGQSLRWSGAGDTRSRSSSNTGSRCLMPRPLHAPGKRRSSWWPPSVSSSPPGSAPRRDPTSRIRRMMRSEIFAADLGAPGTQAAASMAVTANRMSPWPSSSSTRSSGSPSSSGCSAGSRWRSRS